MSPLSFFVIRTVDRRGAYLICGLRTDTAAMNQSSNYSNAPVMGVTGIREQEAIPDKRSSIFPMYAVPETVDGKALVMRCFLPGFPPESTPYLVAYPNSVMDYGDEFTVDFGLFQRTFVAIGQDGAIVVDGQRREYSLGVIYE